MYCKTMFNNPANKSSDYYKILGISKTATVAQIKKEYRQLAMKFHPDRNPNDKERSETLFKQISEAYTILSDPQKRRIYDMSGKSGLNNNGIQFNNISPFEIFETFFGNDPLFSNNMPHAMPNVMFMRKDIDNKFFTQAGLKAPPLIERITCDLEDIYHGNKILINYTRRINKEGVLTNTSCEIPFTIPKGGRNGDKIKIPEYGNESLQGTIGDLFIIIEIKNHKFFKRDSNDLYLEREILLSEALTNFEFTIKTISGENILINHTLNSITNSDSLHVISGLGLPFTENPEQKGNLYITYKLQFPTEIDNFRKEIIKKVLPIRDKLPDSTKHLKQYNVEEIILDEEDLHNIEQTTDIEQTTETESNYLTNDLSNDLSNNINLPTLNPFDILSKLGNLGKHEMGVSMGVGIGIGSDSPLSQCAQQ
jgi:DnaJ family protein B protein 4